MARRLPPHASNRISVMFYNLLLVGANGGKLLLLQHFHERLLKSLAHNNLKNRLHLMKSITENL